MNVYFSAETKQLMPTVTAVDVATAVPVPADQIAVFFPAGPPEGFVPMLCGGASASPGLVPEMEAVVSEAVGKVEEAAVEGATKKKKKDKKEKKDGTVKVEKKKKKGCC